MSISSDDKMAFQIVSIIHWNQFDGFGIMLSVDNLKNACANHLRRNILTIFIHK